MSKQKSLQEKKKTLQGQDACVEHLVVPKTE